MRFFCDNDVDAGVAERLRRLGHLAWTAADAGLAAAQDDDLTVYADDQGAVLITHDHEFSQRRKRNVIGHHVRLRCNEWDAADVVAKHIDDIVTMVKAFDALYIELSKERFDTSHLWS